MENILDWLQEMEDNNENWVKISSVITMLKKEQKENNIENLTDDILNKEGDKYEKELNKNVNYHIDRDYQTYHYKMGIVRGLNLKILANV